MVVQYLLIGNSFFLAINSYQVLHVSWVIFHLAIKEALNAECKVHVFFYQVNLLLTIEEEGLGV